MESIRKVKANQNLSGIYKLIDDFLRRAMDITLSLLGMILLLPLFLLVSIAIKRSSPGPVFYWGPRMGKDGKPFNILKFRTMYERKESYQGPKVTADGDPRITPLGRVLRHTKINELPQLWNVLIGNMSLVGPRPEDPSIADGWPEDFRKEILSVRPGITSPASVIYRNEEEILQSSNLMDTYLWEIIPSKLRLDQLYVRNRSILSDLDVILWTFVVLLPRIKAISVPEHMLYWGPLSKFIYHYLGWFFIDFGISFLAIAAAGVLRRLTTPFDIGFYSSVGIAFVLAFLFSLINTLSGLNRITWSKARLQDALDLALTSTIMMVVVLVANFIIPTETRFPVSVILISSFLSYVGFVSVRYRTRLINGITRRWISVRGSSITSLGERVLIVGAGEVARFAIWLLSNENLAQAFSIVGMVDDDPRKVGTKIDGYSVIHTTNALAEMVKKHDVGIILFAIADIDPTDQDRILAACQATSARIIPIPDILDNLRAQFPINETEREIHFNKVLQNVTTDRLTGAFNRQHFSSLAEFEFNRSMRYDHPLCLIAISLDYLRPASTLYSRAIGSQIMKIAARRCLENIRGIDLLGRFNENILIILLPETDQKAGEMVMDRIKAKIIADPIITNRGLIGATAGTHLVTNQMGSFDGVNDMIQAAIDPLVQSKDGKTRAATRSTTFH